MIISEAGAGSMAKQRGPVRPIQGLARPVAEEIAELKQATREAHEAIKALRELHRDHQAVAEKLQAEFQKAVALSKLNFEHMIQEAIVRNLDDQLAIELEEITQHVTEVRKNMEAKFAEIAATWLTDVLNALENAAASGRVSRIPTVFGVPPRINVRMDDE